MKPCSECGHPCEWLAELTVPRKTDPPMPVRLCPRCANEGRWRRRNMRMWIQEDKATAAAERTEGGEGE